MTLKQHTYVFLGPTLDLTTAQSLLPGAHFLPPIRCGNLVQLIRLNPNTVVIIDGYFEKTAAVWHKEILYALSKGIRVYGASSMGALRAAELAPMGMRGVGAIFEKFYSGELNDDDEVTVLHHSAALNYQLQTDAMVDIRATCEHACREGIIHNETKLNLLAAAKSEFYKQRRLSDLCDLLITQGTDDLVAFQAWLKAGNFISQKRLDAIAALKQVHQDSQISTAHSGNFKFSHSRYFATLNRLSSCEPMFFYEKSLPLAERQMAYARLLGNNYLMVKRLARLLAIASSCDATQPELTNVKPITDNHYETLFCFFLMLSGQYTKLKNALLPSVSSPTKKSILEQLKKDDSLLFNIYHHTTLCWQIIERTADKRELRLSEESLCLMGENFKEKHRLINAAMFKEWLNTHDLTDALFMQLVQMTYRFDYFVKSTNLDGLGISANNTERFWLYEAAQLTGLDEQANALMQDGPLCESTINNFLALAENQGDSSLYPFDFPAGLTSLLDFARQADLSLSASPTKV